MTNAAPIGVFDSGLGGLTVARAISTLLPAESIVYLGDTARVPYGTRSAATVIRYARACATALRRRGVKVLVVACNTVSAVALDMLRVELDVPVIGVIEPGARAGVAASGAKRLGVIATAGTIASGAYSRAVAAIDPRVEVIARAAPLLVPLVEEGWIDGDVPRLAVRRYLEPIASEHVSALVLGCTHYPLLEHVIVTELESLSGARVPVVDSAHATAAELAAFLDARAMRSVDGVARFDLIVTDMPGRFAEIATRFLGRDVGSTSVEQIDL